MTRSILRMALAALVVVLLSVPAVAQGKKDAAPKKDAVTKAEAKACASCAGRKAVAAAMRCESCKAAKVACASCQKKAAELLKKALCGCASGKVCDSCAKGNKKGDCHFCAGKASLAAKLFCSEGCEKSKKKGCPKCAAASKAVSGIPCKLCAAKKSAKSGAGKTETLTQKGLEITVVYKGVEIKGWSKFEVIVKNVSKGPKTLHGRVQLYDAKGKEAGKGTLYVECRKPGQVETRISQAKENGAWKSFKIIVTNIYDF